MKAIHNTGRNDVLVLKINEEDVNTILMNTDVDSDGMLRYAYDNFADNVLEYAFACAEIPREQITRSCEKFTKTS